MTEPSTTPSPPPETTGQLLDELETLLTQQVAQANADDLEGVLAAADKASQLLRDVEAASRPFAPASLDRLERIRRLHRRLCLTLAERKHELARKLQQIGRGKRTLRAYEDKSTAR